MHFSFSQRTGAGSGLSFQNEMNGFTLMTTTTMVLQSPNDGNHYAPANSLLQGSVSDHDNGMAPLALNECGYPIDFSPLEYQLEGGNMVLWNDELGGTYPWDERYYGAPASGSFDPTCTLDHEHGMAQVSSVFHYELTLHSHLFVFCWCIWFALLYSHYPACDRFGVDRRLHGHRTQVGRQYVIHESL